MQQWQRMMGGAVIGMAVAACGSATSTSSSASTTETLTIVGSSTAAGTSGNVAVKSGTLVGTPSQVNVSLYQVYAGTRADCTGLQLLQDNGTAPATFDMVGSPTLYSGALAAGTYQCVVLVISDNITFLPDTAAAAAFPGVCSAGVAATFDIYRTDSDVTAWKDINGTDIAARGVPSAPVSDIVSLFATTDPAAAITALGVNVNQTATLTAALTVPGSLTFYADFTNGITDNDGHCWLEEGTLGFR